MKSHIFSEYAIKLHDIGLNVIPIRKNSKAPAITDWSKWCTTSMPAHVFEQLVRDFPSTNIGLPMGSQNNMVCFDWDYTGENEAELTAMVKEVLPPSPLEKVGKKGFTRFYALNSTNLESRSVKGIYDIISNGRQTIIPPSIHSETGKPYVWVGEHLYDMDRDDIESLPELTQKHIDKIDMILKFDFKNVRSMDNKGRHLKIFAFACACVDECKSVEELSEKLLEYDVKSHGHKASFSDPAHRSMYRAKAPEKCAYNMAVSVVNWLKKKIKKERGLDWDIGHEEVKSKDIYHDLVKPFLKDNLPGHRRCLLTKSLMFKDRGEWTPAVNQIDLLKGLSDSEKNYIPHSKIQPHLARLEHELEPRLLIDIPQWDGVDRISEVFGKYVKITNVSPLCAIEIIKEFGSKMILKIGNSHVQNSMIIFSGCQGIGKDHLIKAMFSHLDCYFSDISLDVRSKKEVSELIDGNILCNVPEFDPKSRLGMAAIKSVLTSSSTKDRFAYQRSAVSRDVTCSLISSSNLSELLVDVTGNRRFRILEIDSIDQGYPEDAPQWLSQFVVLAKEGFKMSKASKAEIDTYTKSKTPIDLVDECADLFIYRARELKVKKDAYSQDIPNENIELFLDEATIIIKQISQDTQIPVKSIQSLLKRKKLSKKIKRNGIKMTVYKIIPFD